LTLKDKPQTFLEHLDELRGRIVKSVLAIAVGIIISFILKNQLFDVQKGLLMLPLRLSARDILSAFVGFISRIGIDSTIIRLFQLFFQSRTPNTNPIRLFAAAPVEKFMVVFKAAFIVGILIASPVIIYQFWVFILPALKRHEKQYVIPLFCITLLFFLIGVIFAFFIVIPISLPVLSGFLPSIENQWRLEYYFSFVVQVMLAFGIAFELPIVMGFVSWIGVFSADSFKRKRKIAIVLIFIASAILTPQQDPFTLFLMAIPLMILYELGIRFAIMIGQREADALSG